MASQVVMSHLQPTCMPGDGPFTSLTLPLFNQLSNLLCPLSSWFGRNVESDESWRFERYGFSLMVSLCFIAKWNLAWSRNQVGWKGDGIWVVVGGLLDISPLLLLCSVSSLLVISPRPISQLALQLFFYVLLLNFFSVLCIILAFSLRAGALVYTRRLCSSHMAVPLCRRTR